MVLAQEPGEEEGDPQGRWAEDARVDGGDFGDQSQDPGDQQAEDYHGGEGLFGAELGEEVFGNDGGDGAV